MLGKNLILFFYCIVSSLFSQEAELVLLIQEENAASFPKEYRVLEPLCVSASKQFSKAGFQYMLMNQSKRPFIVIDLRREFHGFLDGYAVGWKQQNSYEYNFCLPTSEIEQIEKQMLISQCPNYEVETERELVESFGATYVRLPILDHSIPSSEDIERFVALVISLPEESWVHFHCAGGKGRTTLFLAMMQMMRSPSSSLEGILHYQEEIGGNNLYDPSHYYRDQPERLSSGIQRLEFLKKFYQYCQENPDFSKSWSSWVFSAT